MEIEDDKRIQDPPLPLELEVTFTAGAPSFSADIVLGPLPKPPRQKWFIDRNLKFGGFLLKEAIRAVIREVISSLPFGRKRQPA